MQKLFTSVQFLVLSSVIISSCNQTAVKPEGPSNGVPPIPSIVQGTMETFQTDVVLASTKQPVDAYFWAPWCEPCKEFGPRIKEKSKARGAQVVEINLDNPRDLLRSEDVGVYSIPCILHYQDGQEVGREGLTPGSRCEKR